MHHLSHLLQRLPHDVRSLVQQRPSQVKFRFGNNQTLTSMYKVLFPVSQSTGDKVWLGVEVVSGMTPFLFSKRAFKQLGGILDSTQDTCTLTRLQKTMHLSTNATGLSLIDMIEFCQPHSVSNTNDVNSREVFDGSACHVGDNIPRTRDTMTFTNVSKGPFQMPKLPPAQPLCSSIPPASLCLHRSVCCSARRPIAKLPSTSSRRRRTSSWAP